MRVSFVFSSFVFMGFSLACSAGGGDAGTGGAVSSTGGTIAGSGGTVGTGGLGTGGVAATGGTVAGTGGGSNGALFEENFDSAAPGKAASPWVDTLPTEYDSGGKVEVTTAQAHSGTQSVYVKKGSNGCLLYTSPSPRDH
jgi:hypothetical protein